MLQQQLSDIDWFVDQQKDSLQTNQIPYHNTDTISDVNTSLVEFYVESPNFIKQNSQWDSTGLAGYKHVTVHKWKPSWDMFTSKGETPDWLFLLIIGCFIFIAYLRNAFPETIKRYFTATYSQHMADMILREVNPASIFSAFILNMMYLYNFSLLIFILSFNFNKTFGFENLFTYWTIIFVALTAGLLIKFFLIRLITIVFNISEIGNGYLHNMLIFTKMSGIFVVPFVVAIPYVNTEIRIFLLYVSIIMVGILYLYRIFRGAQIIIRKQFSIFYLILYLCILEVLPLFLLIYYLILRK